MKTLRRITALVLSLILIISTAAVPASAAPAAQSPENILASMSAEEKVAQLLMPAFRYYTDSDGTLKGMAELTEDAAKCIGEYGFAGVVLFAQNLADTEKAVKLIDDMQKANAVHKTRLLVSVDQEGGYVTRLGHGTQTAGNMALGAAGSEALTAEAAGIIGTELMAMGINFDFAPVLDINSNPSNPVIGTRSFSDDADTVAKHGVSFVKALQSAGVISTLKHFPGHGDTATDSHTGLPLIDRSYEELKARELVPFKAAIEAGAEAVMTAHIQYPQIEKTVYTSKLSGEEIVLPATLSKIVITDILRGDLGFDGVVVTDAMNMDAIAKHLDRYDAAKLALEAGVDIILMPVDTSTSEGIEDLGTYIKTLAGMVAGGEISAEKVDEAVLRVLRLKDAHGLTNAYAPADASNTSAVGSSAHHGAEWEIAKKAVTLVKNDNNALPFTGGTVSVLTAYDNEVMSMEYAVGRLKDENRLPAGMTVSVHSIQKSTAEEATALTKGADHVVIISELYSAAGLANDYSRKVDAIIDSVHKAGGDVAVMSCHLPYDAARFQAADAIILAWSARGMTEDPRTAEGAPAQYGPNMPAALYLMLSAEGSPAGTIPVDIPALTEDVKYSGTPLYNRGYGLSYGDGFCSRAQFVKMLWEKAGGADEIFPKAGFEDVPGDSAYSAAVDWAFGKGIVSGTSASAFSPNRGLTRAQAVAILWRLQGKPLVTGVQNPFTDVPDSAYYKNAVLWAVAEGITKGTAETTFSPGSLCTDVQAEKFLRRLFDSFSYEHDPQNNPKAMADIVRDRDAVYGFKPSPYGSLKQYAGLDWRDAANVAEWRQTREEYHESLEELYGIISDMEEKGSSTEEIARAVSTRRNELRLEASADDPEALRLTKERNLASYGHEEGPLPEELYEKYGSWETVISKALSANSGMDACLGLYDTYYQLYKTLGQISD